MNDMQKHFCPCTITVVLFGYHISFALFALLVQFYKRMPNTATVHLDLMTPMVPATLCVDEPLSFHSLAQIPDVNT